MTEQEWMVCSDPRSMLHVVERAKPSERKVRLFNSAICRRFWDYLPEASQAILTASELIADGVVQRSQDNMELCHRANAVVAPFDRRYPTKHYPSRKVRIQRDAAAAVCYAVIPDELWGAVSYFWDIDPAERGAHSAIIRDVFGNPFRPVSLKGNCLAWNDDTIPKLAQAAYDERHLPEGTLDKTRLTVLADALEEAGCTETDILGHLRGPGPHVRGCWPVDLCLGKA